MSLARFSRIAANLVLLAVSALLQDQLGHGEAVLGVVPQDLLRTMLPDHGTDIF